MSTPSKEHEILLESTLDISHVETLHQQLEEALVDGHRVTMDASNIEKIDTAALQIILAFVQQAEKQSLNFTWKFPSKIFIDYAKMLGLTEKLKLPKTM